MLMESAKKLGLFILILILFFLMAVVHPGFPGEKREGGAGLSWDTPTAKGGAIFKGSQLFIQGGPQCFQLIPLSKTYFVLRGGPDVRIEEKM